MRKEVKVSVQVKARKKKKKKKKRKGTHNKNGGLGPRVTVFGSLHGMHACMHSTAFIASPHIPSLKNTSWTKPAGSARRDWSNLRRGKQSQWATATRRMSGNTRLLFLHLLQEQEIAVLLRNNQGQRGAARTAGTCHTKFKRQTVREMGKEMCRPWLCGCHSFTCSATLVFEKPQGGYEWRQERRSKSTIIGRGVELQGTGNIAVVSNISTPAFSESYRMSRIEPNQFPNIFFSLAALAQIACRSVTTHRSIPS